MLKFSLKRQSVPKEKDSEHIKIHADPSGKLHINLSDLFVNTDLIDELKKSYIYKKLKEASPKSAPGKSDAD